MDSISYYDKHFQSFYNRTIDADLSAIYTRFLDHVPIPATILDAGCGTGRDAKFFLSKGYAVQAFDGSKEMVRFATKELGQPVFHKTFQSMTFEEEFDAVWACASLLHVPYNELYEVMKSFRFALKTNGIFYASFKYGNSTRKIDEREFFDYNEETIQPYLEELFQPIEIWESADTRIQSASPRKSWLNILCRCL